MGSYRRQGVQPFGGLYRICVFALGHPRSFMSL
jgi:hypothetical protein